MGQTGLEKAIKSETQGLISYSIRDKLWIGLQSAADDTGGQRWVPETAAQNVT